MSESYSALIRSSRVSTRTRQALEDRGNPDESSNALAALDAGSLATLRAVLDRVIPQLSAHRIDLSVRIDQDLASGAGDGWRFAQLPSDAVAYRLGLRTLDGRAAVRYGQPFARLDAASQDALLVDIAEGQDEGTGGGEDPDELNIPQMQAWFEDVRADAVRLYIAHPLTLARIGYSGIANGGDGTPKSGFVRVGLDEREAWEPLPLPPLES